MNRRLTRRAALAGTAALPAATFLPGGLRAEAAWKPSQGIRIVVPAAPGGTTDIWPACSQRICNRLGPVLRRRQQVGRRRRHRLDRGRQVGA